MKVDVYELDTANVVREDTTYYSNADFSRYINRHATGPYAKGLHDKGFHVVGRLSGKQFIHSEHTYRAA